MDALVGKDADALVDVTNPSTSYKKSLRFQQTLFFILKMTTELSIC